MKALKKIVQILNSKKENLYELKIVCYNYLEDVIKLKKIVLILFMVTCAFLAPSIVQAEEGDITVYLFRGSTCQHCEDALEYINDHRDLIPENVEIVTYEVWDNEENATLMDTVADILEVDKTDNYGTPFFVVGREYIKGYGTDTWEELFEIVNDYTENREYEDVVKQTIDEEKFEVESRTLDDLYSEPSPVVTIIVYCVFGAIVLGFVAMIVFSRK